jgi:hypothetical protein
MPALPTPSFLPRSSTPQADYTPTARSSSEEHTDQWISVPHPHQHLTDSSEEAASDAWHASAQDPFDADLHLLAQSSPVRPQLELELTSDVDAEHTSWARHVESHLFGLSPTSPKRSARSRSVDELGMQPTLASPAFGRPAKERTTQVQPHARSRSQADLLPIQPAKKDKESKQEKAKAKKLQSNPSPSSLSRRASAPLLGTFRSKKGGKPARAIDTSSRSYVRPGITLPTISRPTSPVGQLSTFGTVYVPGWDSECTLLLLL